MSLNDNLSAKGISNFASPADQLITLTIGQLRDLITQAVRESIQPLQEKLSELRDTVASQKEELADLRGQLKSREDRLDGQQAEMAAMHDKIASLEAAQDTLADNQLIQLRLINELRESTKKEPQPLQKDRSEILRALLAANGGKMLAKEARQKMHLSRSRFSELLGTLKGTIDVRPSHLNKRQNILILL